MTSIKDPKAVVSMGPAVRWLIKAIVTSSHVLILLQDENGHYLKLYEYNYS